MNALNDAYQGDIVTEARSRLINTPLEQITLPFIDELRALLLLPPRSDT